MNQVRVQDLTVEQMYLAESTAKIKQYEIDLTKHPQP